MTVTKVLLLSWMLCLVSGISCQTIRISSPSNHIVLGSFIDISLDSFDVGQDNTLLGITGGYYQLQLGTSVIPLVSWNVSMNSLQLHDGISVESPTYTGRVSVPTPRTMRISNMSFPDQKNGFRFVMSYIYFTHRTKSSSSITVRITVPPVPVTPLLPKIITVLEYEQLILTCAFEGLPQVSLQWTDKSSRGVLSTPINTTKLPNSIIVSTQSLTVSNVTRSDAGKYECRVSTEAGDALQSTTIQVNYGPVINLQVLKPMLKACVNQTISITCEADGVPVPTVSLLDGSIVLSSSTQGTTTYHLTVTNATFLKQFLCYANNTISSHLRPITFSRRQTASTPQNITVAPTSGNSLKVSWQPSVCIHRSGRTKYIIYVKHFLTDIEMNFTTSCDTGPCQYVITGLEASASYTVSLAAVDESGKFGDMSRTYKIGLINGDKSSDDSNDAIFIVLAVVAGISILLLALSLIWYLHLRKRSKGSVSLSHDRITTNRGSAAPSAKYTETPSPKEPIQLTNNNRCLMEIKEKNKNEQDCKNVSLKFENKAVEVPIMKPDENDIYDTIADYENMDLNSKKDAVGSQDNEGYMVAHSLKRISAKPIPGSEYMEMSGEDDRYADLTR